MRTIHISKERMHSAATICSTEVFINMYMLIWRIKIFITYEAAPLQGSIYYVRTTSLNTRTEQIHASLGKRWVETLNGKIQIQFISLPLMKSMFNTRDTWMYPTMFKNHKYITCIINRHKTVCSAAHRTVLARTGFLTSPVFPAVDGMARVTATTGRTEEGETFVQRPTRLNT